LDADAASADQRADGVNAGGAGGNGDFGSPTGFAGDSFDFNEAIFEFGDLLAEEVFNEFGSGAADNEVGALFAALNAL